MKKITFPIGILLVTGALLSCNSNKKTTSRTTYEEKPTETVVAQEAKTSEEECISPVEPVSSSIEDPRLREPDKAGYNYIYTPPETNFQGASSYGTGSSYASNYYGASERKSSPKVCETVETRVASPQVDGEGFNDETGRKDYEASTDLNWISNSEFATTDKTQESESKTVIENEEEVDWWNVSNQELDSLEQTNQEATEENTEVENKEENNYDELPW